MESEYKHTQFGVLMFIIFFYIWRPHSFCLIVNVS
jgi:hypothetical protein